LQSDRNIANRSTSSGSVSFSNALTFLGTIYSCGGGGGAAVCSCDGGGGVVLPPFTCCLLA
jgi:hypothetical protein